MEKNKVIHIKEISKDEFKVTINSSSKTGHLVRISNSVHQNLTKGKITKEQLLLFSFEFLLDREPNTSILPSFELMEINQYFPEYVEELKKNINN
ncbi:MAG: hypothetical protein CMM95_00265 [Rickettsiales bacterium]|nr:hypothetical protein [Rickettsiales bacterium]|tara:strand:- start:1279 stop:1563 length:285 start_codon:yes stop_codon:yes gene_type:complete